MSLVLTFEAEVQPGFDVGAHRHRQAEEVSYILDGELDLLAFELRDGTGGDWRGWQSAAGATALPRRTARPRVLP